MSCCSLPTSPWPSSDVPILRSPCQVDPSIFGATCCQPVHISISPGLAGSKFGRSQPSLSLAVDRGSSDVAAYSPFSISSCPIQACLFPRILAFATLHWSSNIMKVVSMGTLALVYNMARCMLISLQSRNLIRRQSWCVMCNHCFVCSKSIYGLCT